MPVLSADRRHPGPRQAGPREAWSKLETAKRRLIYTLLSLELPLTGKAEAPNGGLTFRFLADPETSGAPPVLTGHADGVITVNIAEADDSVRESAATRCTRAIALCWAISGTRSAITTGTG